MLLWLMNIDFAGGGAAPVADVGDPLIISGDELLKVNITRYAELIYSTTRKYLIFFLTLFNVT